MSETGRPDDTNPLFNPDSGSHPLPSDPHEIAAVLQATQRCYDANPYYHARYGVRGRSFAHADGGYLVTLTNSWQSYVHEQVSWLASLLAARGMPSWLLEVHLQVLQEELNSRGKRPALRALPSWGVPRTVFANCDAHGWPRVTSTPSPPTSS